MLKALDGQPVDHIFVTHTHRDHSPAAKALQAATGAVTCGYGPHPTGRAEDGGGAPVEDGPDLEFVPEKALADGEIIVAGGVRIEAVHTPGHMSNHMCYAMPDEGILFSGDHVMAWATSVISPPDGRLCAYLASLAKVRDRDETVFWPSHGPAINNPKRLVQAHIDHRHARNEQIIARLEKSEAGIADIVADVYDGLPEDLIEAASLSVLAHLLVLRDEGRVASAGATDFTASWRLV